jgi:hypothetical protein
MIGRTGEETQQRWLLIAVIVCTTPRMRVGTLELGRAESYQQLTATRLCLGSPKHYRKGPAYGVCATRRRRAFATCTNIVLGSSVDLPLQRDMWDAAALNAEAYRSHRARASTERKGRLRELCRGKFTPDAFSLGTSLYHVRHQNWNVLV